MSTAKSLRLNKEHRVSILNSFSKKWLEANVKPVNPLSSEELEARMAERLFLKAYGHVDLSVIDEKYLNLSATITVQLPSGDVGGYNYGFNLEGERIRRISPRGNVVDVIICPKSKEWLVYMEETEVNKKRQKRNQRMGKTTGEV